MNKKRITSLLICIVMVFASVPTNLFSSFAFASGEGGSFYSSFEDNENYSKYVYGKIAKDKEGNPKVSGVRISDNKAQVAGEYIDNWDTIAGSADFSPDDSLKNIQDRNPSTSWVSDANVPSGDNPIWAEMKMKEEKIVRTYSITSADGNKNCDPKSWEFYGSKDGKDWQHLGSQKNQEFSDRNVTNVYTFENETAYMYYRLEITAIYGETFITQFADFAMGSNYDVEKDPNISISNGPKSTMVGKENQGWTGSNVLEVAGTHEVNERAYRYNTLYEDLDIQVGKNTQLSYLIFPDNPSGDYDYDYTSMYMAIDLLFKDGTYLSDLAAVDQYGHGMSAKEQGESKTLYTKQWNEIYSNIGDVAEGLTIDSILVVYDNPFEDTYEKAPIEFRSYFDDIKIETAPPIVHENLSDYVNILRGTNDNEKFSRGLNAPVVTVPNGFNFWAPATTDKGNKIYNYTDTAMTHFTISHEPSIWIGDRGTFQFMANTSISSANFSNTNASNRKATFSHDNEIARAHYYSVDFDKGSNASGVKMEVTPTSHAAAIRFTFPKDSENRNIIFDSVNNKYPYGTLEFSEDGKSFTAKTLQFSNGMKAMNVYGEFDVAASNKSVVNSGTSRGMVSFPEGTTEVTMKIATSFISAEQAKNNLKVEISDSDTFDTVLSRAQSEWDDLLGTIELEGATYDQMVTFYSNMYRMYAYPNSLSENTGTKENPDWKYASPYKDEVKDGILYYNNGFWDTYRTTWAAYALFTPEKNKEMLNGLVQHYNDQGWVPRWVAPGGTNSMVGTNSDVIFGDAIMRGQDFDDDNAYLSAVRNASVVSSNSNNGRSGIAESIFLGYTSISSAGEGMSWGMEGYINDFGIANMAKAMRDKVEDKGSEEYQQYDDEYQYFLNRAQNYVNLFDDKIDFFQGKTDYGTWRASPSSFDPIAWGGDYTETNAWNMAFTVPQDGQGLANLYGGREGLEKKLDEFFSIKGEYHVGVYGKEKKEMREAREVKMGQYGHSNQPSHHIPYMYLYAGQPQKTQEKVREVLDRLYVGQSIGQGYSGDEDNGEMSAWYVLSSLGIYPVNMGSGEFAIGSPLFKKATVHLENGKDLVINAPENSSKNIYVQSVKLNGESWNKTYFDHSDIAEGAVIDFEMGSTPSTWGTDEAALPTSITKGNEIATPDQDVTATNPTIMDSVPTGNQAVDSIYLSESVTDPLNLFFNFSYSLPTFTTDSISIYFSFDTVQKVDMYTITSGEDIQGAPSSWTLHGSNDNQNWVKLDERSDQSFRWAKYTRPFALDEPAYYQNYRLDIDGTNGSSVLNIAELELLGKEGFDKSILGELANTASELTESNYTPDTWRDMKIALAQAIRVIEAEDSTSTQLSEAYYNLKAAIDGLKEIVVDKTSLQNLVNECKDLNKDDYKDPSWKIFSDCLNDAEKILLNNEATQKQVNTAFDLLTISRSKLVPITPAVDKSLLQLAVDLAQKAEDVGEVDKAIDSVKAAFDKAFTKAKAVLADDNATQAKVDEAYNAMSEVLNRLGFIKGDKAALQALYDLLSKYNIADYETGEAKKVFTDAMEAAKKVLDSGDPLEEDVEKAYEDLFTANSGLKLLDRTMLAREVAASNTINSNLDKYVDEGKNVFTGALEKATAVLTGETTQAEIDAAVMALAEARANLRYKANKEVLESLFKEVEALDLSLYTDESVEPLIRAKRAAKLVLDDLNIPIEEQDKINKVVEELANTKNNLQPKSGDQVGPVDPSEPVVPSEPGDPSEPSSSNDNSSKKDTSNNGLGHKTAPSTGDTDMMCISIIALISFGIVANIAYKNKKHNYKQ